MAQLNELRKIDGCWKYYRIPERLVFDFWASCCRGHQKYPNGLYVTFPSLDIPRDAQVLAVNYDMMSKCFVFLVAHASFPLVPQGNLIPIEPNWNTDYKIFHLDPVDRWEEEANVNPVSMKKDEVLREQLNKAAEMVKEIKCGVEIREDADLPRGGFF